MGNIVYKPTEKTSQPESEEIASSTLDARGNNASSHIGKQLLIPFVADVSGKARLPGRASKESELGILSDDEMIVHLEFDDSEEINLFLNSKSPAVARRFHPVTSSAANKVPSKGL